MKPRNSNLPQVHLPSVGLVFTGEVILEKTHHRQGSGTPQVMTGCHISAT
jgi:hypothetical protein